MGNIRPHIFVCTSTVPPEVGASCGAHASRELHDQLPLLLAELKVEEARVTPCGCLGSCGEGSSLVIYPGGVFYRGVTRDNIKQLLERHYVAEEPLEECLDAR